MSNNWFWNNNYYALNTKKYYYSSTANTTNIDEKVAKFLEQKAYFESVLAEPKVPGVDCVF